MQRIFLRNSIVVLAVLTGLIHWMLFTLDIISHASGRGHAGFGHPTLEPWQTGEESHEGEVGDNPLINTFSDPYNILFALNGLGYFTLALGILGKFAPFVGREQALHLVCMAYVTTTILAWLFLRSDRNWLGYLTKAIEATLILLLALNLRMIVNEMVSSLKSVEPLVRVKGTSRL